LERLSDAQANGHDVLAVIRGSAINQDGASNGLTAPNGPSQQRVIRQALSNAGLAPADITAVEAHGTGTALGDPIEAQALQAVYGQDRDADRPLLLGSVKSNIGHTQSAAGVAGVIKMVMALRGGLLPRTLHADQPSSHIDWSDGTVALLSSPTAWTAGERVRRCAVSSFGISGTNAHVVLEEAPEGDAAPDGPATPGSARPADPATAEASDPDGRVVPWVLSARTPGALRAQAAQLAEHLDRGGAGEDVRPADIGHSLTGTRALFEHRAVVLGDRAGHLRTALDALAAGDSSAAVVHGTADLDGRTVFVFPGQGSQWTGMAAELLDESPVFAERLHECAAALSAHTDWSLVDVLRRVDGAPSLDRVDVVQPATFAVMVSLAHLWASYGVIPDAVLGHSQGEIAAAAVAGALTLEDAARVVALRSQAIARGLAGSGGMVSVPLSADEVGERLAARGANVSVAAVNGPRTVVVAGDPGDLDALIEELAAEGVRARRIAVDYASHSAQVEQVQDELLAALAPVRPRTADIPFFSTVTGDWLDTAALDAAYWYRNLRETVRFGPAVAALLDQGHQFFVEASPHTVLTMAVQAVAEDTGHRAAALGTLRRDKGGTRRFLTSLAEAFVRGARVDWTRDFEGIGARRVTLPTYAFQREHLWALPGRPRTTGGADPADAAFWTAVEESDVESLAAGLRMEQSALTPLLPALAGWRRRSRDRAAVDAWRYRAAWKPLGGLPAARLTGTWLVVASAEAPADADVTAALTAAGADVRHLVLDDACADRTVLTERLTRGTRRPGRRGRARHGPGGGRHTPDRPGRGRHAPLRHRLAPRRRRGPGPGRARAHPRARPDALPRPGPRRRAHRRAPVVRHPGRGLHRPRGPAHPPRPGPGPRPGLDGRPGAPRPLGRRRRPAPERPGHARPGTAGRRALRHDRRGPARAARLRRPGPPHHPGHRGRRPRRGDLASARHHPDHRRHRHPRPAPGPLARPAGRRAPRAHQQARRRRPRHHGTRRGTRRAGLHGGVPQL
ncbi:type I polyketide synthase, partial [Streptomyces cremeus]|uniref:type I polyketide synthase n=1 Tax=Streptomyces cremeus TaxID=66881 RepID=UPI003CD0851A